MMPLSAFMMDKQCRYKAMPAFVLVVLACLKVSVVSAFGSASCERPADVVFVLDTSNSIWGPDFDLQLNFVRAVVNRFTVHPDHMRIGMITFGDYPQLQFHLNRYPHKRGVQRAISGIKQDGGLYTFTADALHYMHSRCFTPYTGMRDNATHIAIVITDGRSYDTIKTAYEAELARRRGIHVFAVGVGDKLDQAELNLIASRPKKDYTFLVKNFDVLRKIKDILAIKACTVTEPPTTTTTTTTPIPTTTTTSTTTTTTTTTPATTRTSPTMSTKATSTPASHPTSTTSRTSIPSTRTIVFETPRDPQPATFSPNSGRGVDAVEGPGATLVHPGHHGTRTQGPFSRGGGDGGSHGSGSEIPGIGAHVGGHAIDTRNQTGHNSNRVGKGYGTSHPNGNLDTGSEERINVTEHGTHEKNTDHHKKDKKENKHGKNQVENDTGSQTDIVKGKKGQRKQKNKTKAEKRRGNDVITKADKKDRKKKGDKGKRERKKGRKGSKNSDMNTSKRHRHHHGAPDFTGMELISAAHAPHHITAGCRVPSPTDIVFVVDPKVGGDTYVRYLWKFVHDVIARMRMEPDQLRVQFVHECASVPEIQLLDFTNKTQLLNELDDVIDVPKRTAQMFESMSVKLTALSSLSSNSISPDGTRRRRIGVYVTDGHSVDIKETLAAAKKARDDHGVELFAVGVGGRINPTELRDIVSCEADDHLFMLAHHAKLRKVSRHLAKKLCTVTQGSPE